MPNRNDVAARAGVSPAVVSYVLNDSNYVSAEKRQAVLKAVEDLGYHPNYAARSLKANQTRQLLMVSDDIRNEIFSEMAYHMERRAFERGYFLSVTSCSRKKAMDFENVFYSRQYDAIFLGNNVYSQQEINRIAKKGVPVVLYQTRYYEALDPSVTIIGADLGGATAQLVDYLAAKGHRHIGYIGNPSTPTTPGESAPFGDGLRINGYLEAMERNGLDLPYDYLFSNYIEPEGSETTHRPARGLRTLPDNERVEQTVERVVNTILAHTDEANRPTAYLVTTDRLAAQIVLRLAEMGVRVPEDLEITGFGDSLSAQLCRPQLTTMHIPTEEIARAAMDAMLAKCEGTRPENILFPLQLIVRQSA